MVGIPLSHIFLSVPLMKKLINKTAYSDRIPRCSTDETDFITWLSTWKFVFVRSERLLFNTMAWNLSGFTIILFILNHSIAILLSDSNLFIRSEIVFAQAESKYRYIVTSDIDEMTKYFDDHIIVCKRKKTYSEILREDNFSFKMVSMD